MPRLLSLSMPAVLLAVLLVFVATAAAPVRAADDVVLLDQARAMAGGLNPSDGPGWPITIRQSGTYRLTSDLIVAAPQTASAITIEAENVTIDLNGHGIYGPNQCKPNAVGVVFCNAIVMHGYGIISWRSFTRVRNGRISGMGGGGIVLGAELDTHGGLIENVDISHSGRHGAVVIGGVVRNSSSSFNGDEGFVIGWNAIISGSRAKANGKTGIALRLGGALAVGNVATDNGDYGIRAYEGTGYSQNVMLNNRPGNVAGIGADLGGNLK